MDYGKAFRLIRAAYGLQQKRLAELLGVSRSYISLIESGARSPNLGTIEDLTNQLQIPRSLIDLLAYEKGEFNALGDEAGALALSLLKLLAVASETDVQAKFSWNKKGRN